MSLQAADSRVEGVGSGSSRTQSRSGLRDGDGCGDRGGLAGAWVVEGLVLEQAAVKRAVCEEEPCSVLEELAGTLM